MQTLFINKRSEKKLKYLKREKLSAEELQYISTKKILIGPSFAQTEGVVIYKRKRYLVLRFAFEFGGESLYSEVNARVGLDTLHPCLKVIARNMKGLVIWREEAEKALGSNYVGAYCPKLLVPLSHAFEHGGDLKEWSTHLENECWRLVSNPHGHGLHLSPQF